MADFIEKVYAKTNIAPNLPAELDINEEFFKGKYKTIIHDYNSLNNTADIGYPIYKGAYIKIPMNVNMKVRIFSKTSVFLFKSKVIGKGEEGNIKFLTITVPPIIFKVQRRQFVRIPVILNGSFFIKEEYDELEVPPKYKLITKDFSAGGISMITKKKLNSGEEILINLNLNESLKLENFEARIIREVGTTDFGEIIYGVKFLNVDSMLEKEFVKFIFRYEIEASKKNKKF